MSMAAITFTQRLSNISGLYLESRIPVKKRSIVIVKVICSQLQMGVEEEMVGMVIEVRGNVVPGRKDKSGSNFGFVKYLKVQNVDSLLVKFNQLVLDGCCIRANVSKFSKKTSTGANDGGKNQLWIQGTRRESNKGMGAWKKTGVKLFTDALQGQQNCIRREEKTELKTEVQKVVIPDVLKCYLMDWLDRCLVGEIKDLELLSKCLSMIQVYEMGECIIKYVGGLCVLLEFTSKSVAACFLKAQKVNWSIWILVPFDFNINSTNMVSGTMYIITSKMEVIPGKSLSVEWGKVNFIVRIKEDESDHTDNQNKTNVHIVPTNSLATMMSVSVHDQLEVVDLGTTLEFCSEGSTRERDCMLKVGSVIQVEDRLSGINLVVDDGLISKTCGIGLIPSPRKVISKGPVMMKPLDNVLYPVTVSGPSIAAPMDIRKVGLFTNTGLPSIRFKDVIFRRDKKNKKPRKIISKTNKLHSKLGCSAPNVVLETGTELTSIERGILEGNELQGADSNEVVKTMEVGVNLDYDMEGAQGIFEEIITGEGDLIHELDHGFKKHRWVRMFVIEAEEASPIVYWVEQAGTADHTR
ncbi:hypothetical protein LXL04_020336 [Taraxacum kok-saghyz]